MNLPSVSSSKFSGAEIDLLKNTYAKGLSDTELTLFLKQSEAMNLNPFTKEIYGMVISGKLTLITSIAGLRKIAVESGCYLGCDITVRYEGSKLISARATVKKLVQSHVAEFTAEVMFEEFNTGQNVWKKMPTVMIKKVAEAQALRMAFPSTENLYEESEVGAIRGVGPKTSEKSVEVTHRFTALEARPQAPHPSSAEEILVDTLDFSQCIIPVGADVGKKLADVDLNKLEAMIKWAYGQPSLTPPWQDYVSMAEKYLESLSEPKQ